MVMMKETVYILWLALNVAFVDIYIYIYIYNYI